MVEMAVQKKCKWSTNRINYLRSLCKIHGWELVNVGRNHYNFSAFIRNAENKHVYLSISDVRFFNNEWYYHILIRTAKNERDYLGGMNHYACLTTLSESIQGYSLDHKETLSKNIAIRFLCYIRFTFLFLHQERTIRTLLFQKAVFG